MLLKWTEELIAAHEAGKDVQFFRQSARPESLLLFVTVSDSERYQDTPQAREAGQ